MRSVLTCLLGLVAGYAGSAIERFHEPSPTSTDVIRAHRIELNDYSGHTVGLWDWEPDGEVHLQLLKKNGEKTLELLETQTGQPELNLYGKDNRLLSTLRLQGAVSSPLLGMSDNKIEGRLILGPAPSEDLAEQRHWGLHIRGADFRPDSRNPLTCSCLK